MKEAIEKAGYTGKVEIGMDVAASEFCKNGKYDLDFKNKDSDQTKWVQMTRCTFKKKFVFVLGVFLRQIFM